MIPGLEQASTSKLDAILVSPAGDALSWPSLDVDVHVSGLVERAFGNRLFGIVRSFCVDRRMQHIYHTADVGFVKKHHVVYTTQGRNQRYAFRLAEDRTACILDQPH